MEREFAYGCDHVEGAACPAVTAGFNPVDNEAIHVAETYDSIIQEQKWQDEGVVSEAEAREAWLQAIARIDEQRHFNSEQGREVAKKLGWL